MIPAMRSASPLTELRIVAFMKCCQRPACATGAGNARLPGSAAMHRSGIRFGRCLAHTVQLKNNVLPHPKPSLCSRAQGSPSPLPSPAGRGRTCSRAGRGHDSVIVSSAAKGGPLLVPMDRDFSPRVRARRGVAQRSRMRASHITIRIVPVKVALPLATTAGTRHRSAEQPLRFSTAFHPFLSR